MDGREIWPPPLDHNNPGYEPQEDDQGRRHDHLCLELSLAINCATEPHPAPCRVEPPVHPNVMQPQPPCLLPQPQLELQLRPLFTLPQPQLRPAFPFPQLPPNAPVPDKARASLIRDLLFRGKSFTIPAPHPWATAHRAVIHNLDYLHRNGIQEITGWLRCKNCEHLFVQKFNLDDKFAEVSTFLAVNRATICRVINTNEGFPERWRNPNFPICPNCKCGHEDARVIPHRDKKRSINWLFLLLGEYLSFSTLSELKYFCKHTSNTRTGTKDRLVYTAYVSLCKQLDPNGPY